MAKKRRKLIPDDSVDDHMLGYVRYNERWLGFEELFVPLPEADIDDLIRELQAQGLVINDREDFKRDVTCLVSVGRYMSGEAYKSGLVPRTVKRQLESIPARRAKLLKELEDLDRAEWMLSGLENPPQLARQGAKGRPPYSLPRLMRSRLNSVFEHHTGARGGSREGAFDVFSTWVMARAEPGRHRYALGQSLYAGGKKIPPHG